MTEKQTPLGESGAKNTQSNYTWLFENDNNLYQTFDDSTKKRGHLINSSLKGDIWDVSPDLVEINKNGGAVFFAVQEFNGTRSNANIKRVRAVFLDLDQVDLNRTFDYPVEPSQVIETSPGKHHVYWLVNDFPISDFKAFQKSLASAYGGDPKVCDLARVMRVPGFTHNKDAKNPFMVRIVGGNSKTYSTAAIRTLVPEQPREKYDDISDLIGDDGPETDLIESDNDLSDLIGDDSPRDNSGAKDYAIGLLNKLRQAEEGTRNITLNDTAYFLFGLVKGKQLDYGQAHSALHSVALQIGLEPGEITATMESAWRGAEPDTNDYSPPDDTDLPMLDPVSAPTSIEDLPEVYRADPPLKFNIDYPPGLAGEIADYIFNSSRKPVNSFAIAGALATLAYLNHNLAYVNQSGTSLNLYMCLTGDTGKGKEDPRRAVKRLAHGVNRVSAMHETMSSGAALLRALSVDKEALIMVDEFGLYLQNALSDRGSVHQKDFMKELMSFYGMARDFYAGKTFADSKRSIDRIDMPYVNLLATTTPLELLDGITAKSIDNGFLNRILVVGTNEENPINRAPDVAISKQLESKLVEIETLAVEYPSGLSLEYEPGAFELLVHLAEGLDETGKFANLWMRAEEQTIRIAGLLAIGDGQIIKSSHVQWAWDFVSFCIKSFIQGLDRGFGETLFEKRINKTLEIIRNARSYTDDRQFRKYCQKGYMPKGKLTKLLKMKTKEVDELLMHLLSARQIEQKREAQTACYVVL
ncbi:MAG: hypothetical protein NMNS01_28390 [Nitrosomonas sp.]|nr:MAG: hypothetical protein NMNS01_28390 [Nitrosomonas sp.]